MKISVILATLLAAALAWPAPDSAQQTRAKPKGVAPTAQLAQQPEAPAPAGPTAPGWVSRCTSASRDAPLDCAIEETAVLTKTGQVVVLFDVRVTSDTRTPVAVVQLPLGLNLPAGIHLQVDGGKVTDLPIQTCENRGCYATSPIAPDLLASMKSGKELKISFQNTGKETIAIPMPLSDFAAAYDKIQ